MTETLKITYPELKLIMRDDWHDDRFEVVYDDIPKEGHSSDYIERGKQYRYFEFKDNITGLHYYFSYVWYEEISSDFPLDFLGDPPDGVEFIETSVLVEPPKPKPEPFVELTPAQKADKELWDKYLSVKDECKVVEKKEKISVPKEVIKEIIRFLKEEKFNAYQLREKIIPVCIEYKLEQNSFWHWIQVKRGAWK